MTPGLIIVTTHSIIAAAIGLCSISFSGSAVRKSKLQSFTASLDSLQMSFTPSAGFKETRISPDEDCYIAFRNKALKIESRYYLYSFEKHSLCKRCKSKSICLVPPPEKDFKESFLSHVMAYASSADHAVYDLTKESAAELYNADEAERSTVPLKSELANPYYYASFVCIKRDHVGGAVVVLLHKIPGSPSDSLFARLSGIKFKKSGP
jgi:hypothetical protein